MAPLAGLASTRDGRDAIRTAITEHTNDKGELVYRVRLYEAEWHLVGPRTFTERTIELRADEPYVRGHAEAPTEKKHYEIWPLLMEKAYAKLQGGYNAIGKDGSANEAMETLTGMPVDRTDLGYFTRYQADDLVNALAQGKIVLLSTRAGIAYEPLHLIDKHVYLVTGTEERDGKLIVQLHNPWNRDEPKDVPFDQLNDWFHSVDVGSVRSAP
jgi:hypothetical protein